MGGSKTKSTTTVNIPPPTAEETRAQKMSNLINEESLAQMGKFVYNTPSGDLAIADMPSNAAAEDYLRNNPDVAADPYYGANPQRAYEHYLRTGKNEGRVFNTSLKTPEEQAAADREAAINKYIDTKILGIGPDEETRKLVGDVYQAQRTKGEQDISQFMREQAGQRGLDLATDSPILREEQIARTNLETGLRGAEASSLLDVGQRNQLFAQALNEFQTGLRQQAMINRQNIANAYSDTALGLAANRNRSASTTQTTTQSANPFGTVLGGLGLAGGVATGLGGLFSSRIFKENIKPLSHEDIDAILKQMISTPVYEWKYKQGSGDQANHVGPIVEESPEGIRQDGYYLSVVDFLGYLLASVQALNAKIAKLESPTSGQ